MRTWFYEHPNVAVVLLGLWSWYCGFFVVRALTYDRWWKLLSIAALIAGVDAVQNFRKWWRRT